MGCLDILNERFCVECPEKQSTVRVVLKKTWEKRCGFAMATRDQGAEE
jgi:hypothetical protein